MKRIVCLIVAVIALTATLLATAYIIDNTPDYKTYDKLFADKFVPPEDLDTLHVSSLVSYYYNGRYYYVIEFTHDGDDFEYELLHIFSYGRRETFFSIKYADECVRYFPDYYRDFIEAKSKGRIKIYSDSKIDELIFSYSEE